MPVANINTVKMVKMAMSVDTPALELACFTALTVTADKTNIKIESRELPI